MTIGTGTIELHIPGNGSLKGKCRGIQSIIARVHNEFNVSIAEMGGPGPLAVGHFGGGLRLRKKRAAGAEANHRSQACSGWGVRIKNGGEKR